MDTLSVTRVLMALAFVAGLIGALAWVARRFGLGGGMAVRPGKTRRLQVEEMLVLDAKRRLVLVRRDDTEHLLLLGATGEQVVECDIPAAGESLGAVPVLPSRAANDKG